MRVLIPAVLLSAAMLAAGCDRASTQGTAYNNSGNSAAPAPANPVPTTGTAADKSPPAMTGPTTNLNPGGANVVNDTVTTGKIKAAIAADSGMKDSDVSVSTNSGVVTLAGTVKSQDQVTIATNLAQRQEGVARVESSIAVK